MKNKMHRLVSLVLSVCLLLSNMIVVCFASDEDLPNILYNQTIYSYNNSGLGYSWGNESITLPEYPEKATEVSLTNSNKTQYNSTLQKHVRKGGITGVLKQV